MGDIYGENAELAPLAPCTDPLPAHSGQWYVEYYTESNFQCVQDCQGDYPCNGRPSSYKELYDTFHACCKLHTWFIVDCQGFDETATEIEDEPCSDTYWTTYFGEYTVATAQVAYYPDFGSNDKYCITNEDAPEYVKYSPVIWKQSTLAECCYEHFQWEFNKCMVGHHGEEGEIAEPCSPPPEPSNKWYVLYPFDGGDAHCVRECVDGPEDESRCGGRASSYEELYDTFNECCEFHLFWQDDCDAYDENGNRWFPHSMWSEKFYVDWPGLKCAKDCDPADGLPCMGNPPEPTLELFDTARACCKKTLSWKNTGECISETNG